jgi:hypothetical protein
MKTKLLLRIAVITVSGLFPVEDGFAEKVPPQTYCRFVPERKDDFAWENDLIAFRVYGPALRKGKEDSGIDCWLKRVDYPIIDKWYSGHASGKSYHKDRGEGYDPYHTGSSRGCGGLGLWIDGKLVTSDTFTDWKVLKNEPAESIFVLSYAWEFGGDMYSEEKQISIKLGERLFKSTSTFKKNGELAIGLPVAVGLTTHDGKAEVFKDISAGWIACWETIDGHGLGTGVVVEPAIIDGFEHAQTKKKDKSHALIITKTDTQGQVEYFAGYGWEKAGEIKTPEDWNRYLESFKK